MIERGLRWWFEALRRLTRRPAARRTEEDRITERLNAVYCGEQPKPPALELLSLEVLRRERW